MSEFVHPHRDLIELRMTNGRRMRLCPRDIASYTETDSGRVFVVTKGGQNYHVEVAYEEFTELIRQRAITAEEGEA
jgi:hypothetical protein